VLVGSFISALLTKAKGLPFPLEKAAFSLLRNQRVMAFPLSKNAALTMRKFLITFSLYFTLFVGSSSAFLPLIPLVPAALQTATWISIALHTTAAAGGVYYYMKQGQPSTINSNGDVLRPSAVTWIDMSMVPPVAVEKNITTKMSATTVKSLANPSKYPLLSARIANSGTASDGLGLGPLVEILRLSNVYPDGSHIVSGTRIRRDLQHPGDCHIDYPDSTDPHTRIAYHYDPVVTSSNIGSTLSTLVAPSISTYQAELDKMMQDPNYVPSFSDDTTGLPFTPPSNVMTPEQLASYNAKGVATESKEAALNTAKGASNSARDASNQAANNYISSGGNLSTGVGGDQSLYQKYLDAKSIADQSDASRDKLKAEQDSQTADESEGLPNIPGNPEKKQFDFTPLDQVKNALATTYPFNLPQSIASYYTRLSGGTGLAPSFTLPMPNGNTMTIDLSIFDPVAVAIRFLVALVITVGVMYYLIHFYRGIS
jgi:hypothetical protein